MKHLSASDEAYAEGLLSQCGLSMPNDTLGLLLRHVDWLIDTNQTMNLTAVTAPRDAIRLHLVDSLLALPEVASAPSGLLIDVGTGGGFPGIELGLASQRQTLLVDSVAKKVVAVARFLTHESLEATVSVSPERAEALALQLGSVAAVVTARAVAELPVLVELASPLLQAGGVLVALKGRMSTDEHDRGCRAGALCGMRSRGVRRAALPGGDEVRSIVVFERVGKSKTALPRRIGLANKSPLA